VSLIDRQLFRQLLETNPVFGSQRFYFVAEFFFWFFPHVANNKMVDETSQPPSFLPSLFYA
jgi:hypothetical protein